MRLAFLTQKNISSGENLMGGQLAYWLQLVVPVGGPFVYHATSASCPGKLPYVGSGALRESYNS